MLTKHSKRFELQSISVSEPNPNHQLGRAAVRSGKKRIGMQLSLVVVPADITASILLLAPVRCQTGGSSSCTEHSRQLVLLAHVGISPGPAQRDACPAPVQHITSMIHAVTHSECHRA